MKGHIARACRSRKRNQPKIQPSNSPLPNTNPVREEEEGTDDEVYTMFPLRTKKYKPIYVTVQVNNASLRMEVDTGATLSVISDATYHQLWEDKPLPLSNSNVRLRTNTGEDIPVTGHWKLKSVTQLNRKSSHSSSRKGMDPAYSGEIGWQSSSLTGRALTKFKNHQPSRLYSTHTKQFFERNSEQLPVPRQNFMLIHMCLQYFTDHVQCLSL